MRGHARRLPVVGVLGSGRDPWPERAQPLGRWLARQGVHLLTGGGGGVMASVARAYAEVPGRAGLALGVLPGDGGGAAPAGYPNPWIELCVRTHLSLSGERGEETGSRNHLNVLSADVLVALPGSAGTRSEVALAVRYGRPLVAFLSSSAELPGLPPEVPVRPTLPGVQAFVRRVLGA